MRQGTILLAALAAGAAGLATEVLLSGWAGLVVGQARGAAAALAAWIAAWSLGAYLGGVPLARVRPERALPLAGLAAAALAVLAAWMLQRASGTAWSDPLALGATLAVVGLAALPHGAFLPLLARVARARDVAPLFAADLLGSVLGAQLLAVALVARAGRTPALLAASGCAALAGALGLLAARSLPAPTSEAREAAPTPAPAGLLAAGLALGLAAAWTAAAEWVGLRLGALWLGGLAPALAAVLAASLTALALGAALLPPVLPRDARGPLAALLLGLVGAAWVVLGPGPSLLATPRAAPFAAALLLVGPLLAPLGAVPPLLHRAVAGESGARLGRLLVHELWGAPLGLALAHVWLVPRLGCGGTLGVLALAPALAALALRRDLPRAWTAFAVLAGLGTGALLLVAREPALRSPAIDRPDFQVLAFEEDEEFAVTVVQDGLRGERTLLTDEFRATAVGDDYLYMRVLGHLPLLLHPDPRRVAVLAFGTGTTAGAVGLHPEVARLDVLEISRAVLEDAPWFEDVNRGILAEGLPGLLDPDDGQGRVVVLLGDGRRSLARARPGSIDVLTMEPLLPDSPAAVFLYTDGFYEVARRALAPGGLVCQWVPPHALHPETFTAVVRAFVDAFPWSGVFLFGTQVILLGGERPPALDPERFPRADGELGQALAALGLGDVAGLAARFVCAGEDWPRVDRPLRDADPWVLYRPRPRGGEALAFAPTNLALLRALEAEPPDSWRVLLGPAAVQRRADVRAVHRARVAWARYAAQRMGVALAPAPELPPLSALASELRALSEHEVEAGVLLREIRLDEARLGGVDALRRGDAPGALDLLTRAATLAPERADLHLFTALAAARLGEADLATAAARRAYALCPRLLETVPGRAALDLGLPPALQRAK